MADADRKSWIYANVSADERAALRRMAKAENKTVEKLCQDILYPTIQAEVAEFVKKEAEAQKKADEERAKADAEKAKSSPAASETPSTVDPKQFAGAAKS